jgi:aryl-alcohol dehydrogenase-like predicted oxidoreductase
MRFNPLGDSGLELPVVSFGAWAIGGWYWGGPDDENAIRAIHAALDAGITCIDTAPTYGMGHSEVLVGRALRGRRDGVIVATKCGMRWDRAEGQKQLDTTMNDGTPCTIYRNGRPDSIIEECEQSLKRLETDVIDLYQIHWPDSTWPLDDTMEALIRLKDAGKIRAIGVSNFDTAMIRLCQTKGPVDSVQPKYNALQRDAEAELLPFCLEQHIGVLAYSPIAQGLLTGKVTAERTFPEGDIRNKNPLYKPENRAKIIEMLGRVEPLAKDLGVTLGQLYTAWLVHQPGVTTALVGARNEAQAQENARAGSLVLGDAALAFIREQAEALGEIN